jgi:hypothetical protein
MTGIKYERKAGSTASYAPEEAAHPNYFSSGYRGTEERQEGSGKKRIAIQ